MPKPAKGVPAATLFLRDRFGGDFEIDEGVISVGVAVTQLVKNDPEAVMLFLMNMGSNNIYVRPSNTVAVGGGVELLAGGGYASLSVRDDATLPTRGWYGIADTAATDLYYIRARRYVTIALA